MFGPPTAGSSFGSTPAAQMRAAGEPKPFGILAVSVFVAITSLVGLYVALDYAYWSNWNFSYDDFGRGMLDGAFALAYVITSVYGFTTTPKLWAVNSWCWPTANMLAAAWFGLNLLGIVLWGMTPLSMVGLVAISAILVYLNLTPTRAMFGRGPLATFGQPS
jgi:hypothetical protein